MLKLTDISPLSAALLTLVTVIPLFLAVYYLLWGDWPNYGTAVFTAMIIAVYQYYRLRNARARQREATRN